MKTIEVIPQEIALGDEYFKTVTDSTGIITKGVGPCIGAIFYREYHLGVGHFNRSLTGLKNEFYYSIKPKMEECGKGKIHILTFTGMEMMDLMSNGEFMDFVKGLEEDKDVVYDYFVSFKQMLSPKGPINKLQANLTGEKLEKLVVNIEYFNREKEEYNLPEDNSSDTTMEGIDKLMDIFRTKMIASSFRPM